MAVYRGKDESVGQQWGGCSSLRFITVSYLDRQEEARDRLIKRIWKERTLPKRRAIPGS